MGKSKKVVRYYSINRKNLDKALRLQFEFFMECASLELKEKAWKELGANKEVLELVEQGHQARIEALIEEMDSHRCVPANPLVNPPSTVSIKFLWEIEEWQKFKATHLKGDKG